MMNGEGADDRMMLPVFETWLASLKNNSAINNTSISVSIEEAKPFYAQFYAL